MEEWNNFCNNLKEVLELDKYKNVEFINWKITDENLLINYYISKDKLIKFTYTKTNFQKDYKNIKEDNELSIVNTVYYEVPISIRNDRFPIMPRYDRIIGNEYKDNENNLQYKIDRPSKQFFLRMIELKIRSNAMLLLRRLPIYEKEYKFKNGIKNESIFELLRIVYRDCITLKIYSSNEQSKMKFESLANAFIFNVNYNADIGIRQTYDLENVYERRMNNRFRHENVNEIEPPKRIYKRELIEQYNMASISEDPFIKYLCYYHILEHFYEFVYKEQLINIVKGQLTLPSFSIKKDKEIIKLIDIVKQKIKSDKESFAGDELESLELVIKKYIDLDTLKDKISSIDPELVTYYDKTNVNFSKGIAVNFNDKDNLCKNISKRVYFTRNALVHYKSNELNYKEKGIYRPFDDRKDLLKEVPLIRILAEEVIINDSKLI